MQRPEDLHEAELVPPPAAPLLELRNISKSYGRVVALRGVSLVVRPGEVVGLIGDNGAGKSTIVKIIMGYTKPTSGEVWFQGKQVAFDSPAQARALGIEPVYQDLALVGELSLWRNFFLGRELVQWEAGPIRLLDRTTMRSICAEALAGLGLTSVRSMDEETDRLSGGERQSLAITRAVHFGAQMLLLDEPTAALSVRETDRVLDTIQAAGSKGLGVVFIDHNMAHVEPAADRIVVIEHGRAAETFVRGQASVEELKRRLSRQTATEEDMTRGP